MSVKKAVIFLVLFALLGSGGVLYFGKRKNSIKYNSVIAKKGELIQTVSETGTVKASKEYMLGFLNSGKIGKILVEVGDKVKKGDLLAALDYSDLEIQKQEAEAGLDEAEAALSKLLDGASAEDIEVARAAVEQARSAYLSAEDNLKKVMSVNNEIIAQAEKTKNDLESNLATDVTTYEQAIISAQTNLDNIKTTYLNKINDQVGTALVSIDDKVAEAEFALDMVMQVLEDEDGKDYISVKNKQYATDAENLHNQAIQQITLNAKNISKAKSNYSYALTGLVLTDTLKILNTTFLSLKACFNALDNSITSSSFTMDDINTLKSSVSAQQTIINSGISSLQTLAQNLDTAVLEYETNLKTATDSLTTARVAYENALKAARDTLATAKLTADKQIAAAKAGVDSAREALNVAEAKLKKTEAPANKHEVYLNQAKIKRANAAIKKIDKQIENSKIYANIDGTITKVNFEVGEQVTAVQSVLTLLSDEKFEIELLVAETDIAKVNIGDIAIITLDAFGDDVKFHGTVSSVEPAATEVQDVVYYKVKIPLQTENRNVKAGMTANVDIITNKKDNVIIIPGRAVIVKNNGNKFVRVLINNNIHEVPVVIGMRGDDGLVEIVSGIKVGAEVITSIIEQDN